MIIELNVPQNWLFPGSFTEAAKIQREMAEKVITEDQLSELRYIAGMDVSNNPYDPQQLIYASAVVIDAKTEAIIEVRHAVRVQQLPYKPGFLGFREAPALVEAYQQLKHKPSVIFVDGHGISHPRGLGIASHLGVLLDVPTIGVAKTILIGKPASSLATEPGTQIPLLWHDQMIVGMLLRTKARSNPLIISAGHKISLLTAIELVRSQLRGYRLPEPTRQAHLAANQYRKSFSKRN